MVRSGGSLRPGHTAFRLVRAALSRYDSEPGLEDVGPGGEPVDDGPGEARIAERPAPFAERCVAGDGDRHPLVTLGQDLEEELGAALIEMEIAELVEVADGRMYDMKARHQGLLKRFRACLYSLVPARGPQDG